MSFRYHRRIFAIAAPSTLTCITVPLLSFADMSIAGRLGSASAIGAVAVGTTIFNMIYWIFAFLRMGTSGLTAQAFGAKNSVEIELIPIRAVSIAFFLAIIILLFQQPIYQFTFLVMKPSTDVAIMSKSYFSICVWGAPAVLGLYALTGWFIGMGKAQPPLYIAIFQNLINIVMSLYLVFVLHMGIRGIALGTVIASYIGFSSAFIIAFSLFKYTHSKERLKFVEIFQKESMHSFFSVGRDIFLRTLCLVCVTVFFTSAGARSGDNILAANALLMQLFTLYSYFTDGIANAGESLAGQAAGGFDVVALRRITSDLFLWGIAVAVLFTFVYLCFGEQLIALFTDNNTVQLTASHYVLWVAFIPTASFAAFVYDGIFIGLTETRYMLLSMLSATVVFFVLYVTLAPHFANNGLWAAFISYLLTRGIVQHVFYKKSILK